MPHTGILAANPDGAALCLLTYCREGAERLGSHTYPDVTLDYIGFGHHLVARQAGRLEEVAAGFSRSVDRLAAAGAEFFVCPDNTAHLVLDRLGPRLALPGLHIAHVAAEAAHAAGYRRIGLLGTRFLVDSDLYPACLTGRGIATERLPPEDEDALDRIIFGELVDGVAGEATRAWLVDAVARLAGRGCDAVALASTELPVLLGPEHSPLPLIDSTRLVARAALDVALGTRPRPTWRGGPQPPP